jgi:Flp pilus assembly protein TadG
MRRFLSGSRGATAVEFALVALPFVILMLGLIEFGRALHIRNGMDNAADRAQRQIILDAAATSSSLTTSARATFLAGDPGKLLVVLSEGTSGSTTYRIVELSYTMTLLVPIPMNGDIVLSTRRKVALSE